MMVATLLAFAATIISVRPGDDLIAARDRARAAAKPVEIVLEDGVYPIGSTVRLEPEDSGLKIRARNKGKAIVTGGWTFAGKDMKPLGAAQLLNRLDRSVRGKVVSIEVPETVSTNIVKIAGLGKDAFDMMPVLSVDGAYMRPASWPNPDQWAWMTKTNKVAEVVRPRAGGNTMMTNAVLVTHTGRERRWDTSDADIFMYGFQRGCSYSTVCWPIAGYLPKEGGLELVGVANPPVNTVTRFRYMNVFEEIDEPGEWCFDARSRTLVLYPNEDFSTESVVVLGLLSGKLIEISGNQVVIEGLVFTGKRGGRVISVEKGNDNRIVGCKFGAVNVGVKLEGFRNKVLSCDFIGVQGNCVEMTGGCAATLERSDQTVENCLFENFANFRYLFSQGAVCTKGCGMTVRNCVMHGSIEHAVDFYASSECLLEYCRIYDVSREFDDSGAVYLSSPMAYGSVLRYNDIGSSPGMANGIYLDDFCCGVKVYGNVIRNAGYFGIFIGGGRDLTIENNIITACWGGLRTDNRGLFWPAWKDKERCWAAWCKTFGLTNGSPFSVKYPQFANWWKKDGAKMLTAPVDCTYRNNLMLDLPGYSTSFFVAKKRGIPEDRVAFKDNLAVRTFGLKEGASDLASGDSSKAKTNQHSNASLQFRPIGTIRVLDGSPSEPVDLGFVRLPKASFDHSAYMFEQQGWIDTEKLRDMRQAGKCRDRTDLSADFSLRPNARLLKEIPGFQPIPWDKIGPYRDEWRAELPDFH